MINDNDSFKLRHLTMILWEKIIIWLLIILMRLLFQDVRLDFFCVFRQATPESGPS